MKDIKIIHIFIKLEPLVLVEGAQVFREIIT